VLHRDTRKGKRRKTIVWKEKRIYNKINLMGIGSYMTSAKGGCMDRYTKSQEKGQPLEDRALKAAAQFMGEELLPLLGVEGTIKRVAPTEQVHLEIKDFMEDFNYEMEDGTWRHLEFESDSIKKEDLRRFRSYEAITSYYYKAEVTTYVICSSKVQEIQEELTEGISTYRIRVIRLKDKNADEIIRNLEKKQKRESINRQELVQLLLTPLMGGNMPQPERIQRSLRMLQKEREYLTHEDLMRMQAVLYTLAMKFLTMDELDKIKEALRMTVLGEMLRQDGVDEGIEKGIEKGIRVLILDNIEEGIPETRILEKLCRRFQLDAQKAKEYYDRFSAAGEIPANEN